MDDPTPAPVLLAVGIGGILLLGAMALAFAGPGSGFMEGFMDGWAMDIDMDGGDVKARSVRATSTYEPTSLRRDAVVEVTLHATDPDAARMRVSLSAEPCAAGGHRAPADRETIDLPARNGTWTERVTLSGTMPPGPASVVVEIERNGLGGERVSRACRDLPRA